MSKKKETNNPSLLQLHYCENTPNEPHKTTISFISTADTSQPPHAHHIQYNLSPEDHRALEPILINAFCFISPYANTESQDASTHTNHLNESNPFTFLYISHHEQTLTFIKNKQIIKKYAIATGKTGMGQSIGSYQTPLGLHRVCELIGEKEPLDTFYKSRVAIGSYLTPPEQWTHEKDWILTRIIRLTGLENGFNHGQNAENICVDTFKRYIYIHGTPQENFVQAPSSHGCIRMLPEDIASLFPMLSNNTLVLISMHTLLTSALLTR